MPSSQLAPFAPAWLRCGACITASLLFPALLVANVILGGPVYLMVLAPIVSIFSYTGLHLLVTGRPPQSLYSCVVDIFNGRVGISHDNDRRQRSRHNKNSRVV